MHQYSAYCIEGSQECVCVCLCVCVCVYHTQVNMRVCICLYADVCACVYVGEYVCVCLCVYFLCVYRILPRACVRVGIPGFFLNAQRGLGQDGAEPAGGVLADVVHLVRVGSDVCVCVCVGSDVCVCV